MPKKGSIMKDSDGQDELMVLSHGAAEEQKSQAKKMLNGKHGIGGLESGMAGPVRYEPVRYDGRDLPELMGNGPISLGVTFDEYKNTHNDAMYQRLYQMDVSEFAEKQGYKSVDDYYVSGYRQAAVRDFEVSEAGRARLGIDTMEPVEYMNAAALGYRDKMAMARDAGYPPSMSDLRKMNQCVQAVNAHVLSHGCAYDEPTSKAMAECFTEYRRYGMEDGRLVDNGEAKRAAGTLPDPELIAKHPGSVRLYMMGMDKNVSEMTNGGYGYTPVYTEEQKAAYNRTGMENQYVSERDGRKLGNYAMGEAMAMEVRRPQKAGMRDILPALSADTPIGQELMRMDIMEKQQALQSSGKKGGEANRRLPLKFGGDVDKAMDGGFEQAGSTDMAYGDFGE